MDEKTFIETLKEIPLEENNFVSTYGSVDVSELLTTINRFGQVPNYETLLKENNTLNKGIDELIEKYEKDLKDDSDYGIDYDLDRNIVGYELCLSSIIQDLKKLKGE